MKKRLQLSRETLLHLLEGGAAGAGALRPHQAAGGAAIPTTTNPSVVDGCPSTPVWCPQYTQNPCPRPTTAI